MQGGFKILNRKSARINLAAEKFASLCKVEFYQSATPQNFQLLVFWRRAYAAYVFARAIIFNYLYFGCSETAPEAAAFKAA